jgi:transposase-like protein
MTSKQQQNIKIPQDLKTKILQEALLSNSSIAKIAKHYNLSPKSIYNWRNQYYKKISDSSNTAANSSDPTISTRGNFIELTTKSSFLSPNKIQTPNSSNLSSQPNSLSQQSKISLSFNNFSLSLTGSFSPVTLIKIINILGESC